MPVAWDIASERRLLLCAIDPNAKLNWEKVAGDMGDNYTAEACRQHFRKLKKSAMGEGGNNSTSPVKENGAVTPKKRKAKDPNATPSKRGRKPKAEPPVKTETPVNKMEDDVKNEVHDGVMKTEEEWDNGTA